MSSADDERLPRIESLEPGYEVVPVRIGRSRRAPLLVLLLVAGIGLLLAKPWAGEESRLAVGPSPMPTPSATEALPVAGDGPVSSPAGPPFGGVRPIIEEGGEPFASALLVRAGEWGVASGGWWPSGGEPWTYWTDAVAIREGTAVDRTPACGQRTDLPAGRFVAITAPSLLAASGAIEVIPFGPTGRAGSVPELRIVRRLADRGTVFLLRRDGAAWRPGGYRFVVTTPAGPVSLDACLAAGGPSFAFTETWSPALESSADAEDELLPGVGPVRDEIREHAGQWGIGSAGWDIDGTSWSSWRSVDPRDPLQRAPIDCVDGPLQTGLFVALTAPRDPPADGTPIRIFRLDRWSADVMEEIRQISSTMRRGIAYLYRSDGRPWDPGVYRFVVLTSDGRRTVDGCLVSAAEVSGILTP